MEILDKYTLIPEANTRPTVKQLYAILGSACIIENIFRVSLKILFCAYCLYLLCSRLLLNCFNVGY